MRNYGNAREVMHAFAHGEEGPNKTPSTNVFFEGNILYSYGYHYPMVVKLANCFLVNATGYSVTTAKHTSYAQQAIRGNGVPVLEVPFPDVSLSPPAWNAAQVKANHGFNLEYFKREFASSLGSASRARTYQELHLIDAKRYAKQHNRYLKLFKIRRKEIDVSIFDSADLKEMLATAKKEQEIAAAKKKAALKRKHAKSISDWRKGLSNRFPGGLDVALRISSDGSTVETSQNANFPVEFAATCWAMVKRCIRRNEAWTANGSNIKLGIYYVNNISAKGVLRAGCHTVQFAEIKHCAKLLNLKPIN